MHSYFEIFNEIKKAYSPTLPSPNDNRYNRCAYQAIQSKMEHRGSNPYVVTHQRGSALDAVIQLFVSRHEAERVPRKFMSV